VVAADTLLGLDDQPADLAGYGPITAQHARELAAAQDATWRRLLTDPDTGALLDYGRTSYRPPQHLTDFVLARDPVCFFPHCHQPGYLCDLDHTLPWNEGGHTCPANNRPGPAADDTTTAKPAASSATASPTMVPTPGLPTPATPTPAIHRSAGPATTTTNPTEPRRPNGQRRNRSKTDASAKTATTRSWNAGYSPKSSANTTPGAPATRKQPNAPSPTPADNATTNSKMTCIGWCGSG
jgi:hypothetical protein